MYFDVNKLKTLFPYVSPILIFLGYLRLEFYYSAFNISISNFLELSEILTAFLEDILFISAMLFFGFLFDIFTTSKEGVASRDQLDTSSLQEKSILKRFSKWTRHYLPFLVPANLSFILFALIYYIIRHTVLRYFLWLIFWLNIIPLTGFIVMEIRRTFYIVTNTIISRTAFNLTFGILVIIIMLVQRIQLEISMVKDYKKYYGVSFMIDDTLIKSDSIHYYIGNTNKYLFYYLQDSSKTYVYPISRIKLFSFK